MKKLSQADVESAKAAVASFIMHGILVSTLRMSSLVFVASMTRFDVDRQSASLPFLLCYMIRSAGGPLMGFLGGRFGLKNVTILGCLLSFLSVGGCFFAESIQIITILWGVGYGFGFGLGISFLPLVLKMHFSNHLDKVIGISVGSECIAAVLLTLLTKYLLNTYGLSGTFLLLSGVLLHSVPAAMLIQIPKCVSGQNEVIPTADCVLKYNGDEQKENPTLFSRPFESKPNQQECNKNDIHKTSVTTKQELNTKSSLHGLQVFFNPTYILILLTQSSYAYIYTSTNTVLVDIVRDHGASIDDAVYILAGFQMADAVGRFTLGFFTDRGYLSKANFTAVCFFVYGVLLVAFILIRGFVGMVTFVFGLGIFEGGFQMVSASFIMQYVEKDYLNIALPSRYFLYVPLSFTQAPLIGFFRDKLHSYNGLLYILFAICCASGIISLMVPFMERCSQRKKKKSQDKEDAS